MMNQMAAPLSRAVCSRLSSVFTFFRGVCGFVGGGGGGCVCFFFSPAPNYHFRDPAKMVRGKRNYHFVDFHEMVRGRVLSCGDMEAGLVNFVLYVARAGKALVA